MPHPTFPTRTPTRRQLSVDDYVTGVLAGERAILGRAITLIESMRPADAAIAQHVLTGILPATGKAHRVGITGVPGVGKSTFIETMGRKLTAQGKRVAVLAIDPSSAVSGGSILGDKTRMNELACDPLAFVRPSPSACTLGGVARKTRETMLLCEAAGFDVVLIETVGVGQSETVVHDMVDFFLVLMLAGAGDELQGIKRGVLELADLIAVNKADGDNAQRCERSRQDYANALHVMAAPNGDWTPTAITCSGLTGLGLDDLWASITKHRELLTASGHLEQLRRDQQVHWMWSLIEERLLNGFREHPDVARDFTSIERAVREGTSPATVGAETLLRAFGLA
ncbi:MAG: methylmalonyl Co-A mutase-associated GTPase MeaB [Planctomycetota bacterium]|jgi:LAO/AO transport system kinase|nr:methylmalonyl Co-A mutase-associated GTPase MeaB [Planctomycetota bacterium]